VNLVDFENFVDAFLRALRDFDRSQRSEPTRKSGHPTKRSEQVTAFRLTHFKTGSGIATLEPTHAESDEPELIDDDLRLPIANLDALLSRVEDARTVDPAVADALDDARRAFGDDGAVEVTLPSVAGRRSVRIDGEATARMRRSRPGEDTAIEHASGLLHLIDIDPDRVGIRSPAGIEWSCHYGADIEPVVRALVGKVVWVRGDGRLTSPVRGTMEISSIHEVDGAEQTELFSFEPIPTSSLLAAQGVAQPQGIASLADPAWSDDDESEDYLRAIFGDER
jgi:hypothetical protein